MKINKKFLPAIVAFIAAVALVVPAAAWFGVVLEVKIPAVSGATQTQYFAGGDGSAEDPYLITKPVHVYNLAWLQYLGYFNLNPEFNNGRAQNYFKIENPDGTAVTEIDMSELDGIYQKIPPIGTTQYPFLGNFDGNGCVITNAVTANALSLLQEHPILAEFLNDGQMAEFKGSEQEACAVMGFFGVVGNYNGESTDLDYVAQQGGVVNPGACPEGGDTETDLYVGSITAANFAVLNYTLTDTSTATYAGFLVGYLNADVENMLAGNCTLAVPEAANSISPSLNISDHGLVGYCTDEFKSGRHNTTVKFYTPDVEDSTHVKDNTADGNAQGWGGSIAMDDLFSNLDEVVNTYQNGTALNNYVYRCDRILDSDGNIIADNLNTDTAGDLYTSALETVSNVTINNVQYDTVTVKDYFNIITQDPNDSYMYIAGGKRVTLYSYVAGGDVTAYYISMNGQYLTVATGENPAVTSGTTQETKWICNSDGHLYTVIDGNPHFLNTDGTSLSLSKVAETSWTLNANANVLTCVAGSTVYGLVNENGTWLLEELGGPYYILSNDGYYLTSGTGNNPELSGTTNRNNATAWNVSGGNSGTITTVINGSTYYLRHSDNSLSLSTSTESTTWNNSNGQLYYETIFLWSSTTYYLYHTNNNNSPWGLTNNENNANTFTFIPQNAPEATFQSTTAQSYNLTEGKTILEFDETNSTYIPLQMQMSGNDCLYIPENNNTGYITSGSYSRDDGEARDLRVSRYGTSNISTKEVIHVVNPSGTGYSEITLSNYENDQDYINANLQKFKDSVETYEALINASSGNLYGLHFMKGLISTDSLVTIPKAVINGQSYENYQVPADCIDFRIAEKGYINFYAGTYYGNTNSGNLNNYFFTLHRIVRNEDNTIREIKEISRIYENTANKAMQCIYEYTDGTLEQCVGTTYTAITEISDDDYDVTFDLKWINSALNGWENYQAYYFEVPVSPGEYALGSSAEDGKNGAYLIYLDISANAQLIERTTVVEIMEKTTESSIYVDRVSVASDGYTVIPDNEYVSIELSENFGGEVTLTRTGNQITVSDTADVLLGTQSGVTVTPQLQSAPGAKTTVLTKRVTYTDINYTTNTTTVMIFTWQKINGEAATITATDGEGNDISDTVIVSTTEGETILKTTKKDDKILWSEIVSDGRDVVLQYEYAYEALVEDTVHVWTFDPDTNTYDITITPAVTPDITVTADGYTVNIN